MGTRVVFKTTGLRIKKENCEKALAAINAVHEDGNDYDWIESPDTDDGKQPDLATAMWQWQLCDYPGEDSACKTEDNGDFTMTSNYQAPWAQVAPMLKAIAPFTEDCVVKCYEPDAVMVWTIKDGKFSETEV